MKTEIDKTYAGENKTKYNFVTDVLARKTGANENVLKELPFEKINLLWALEGAFNDQAMTRLAQKPELMDTDPNIHALMITATAWWIDQTWKTPADVLDYLTVDKRAVIIRFNEIAARVGDTMWDQYRADLKNLQIPDGTGKTP